MLQTYFPQVVQGNQRRPKHSSVGSGCSSRCWGLHPSSLHKAPAFTFSCTAAQQWRPNWLAGEKDALDCCHGNCPSHRIYHSKASLGICVQQISEGRFPDLWAWFWMQFEGAWRHEECLWLLLGDYEEQNSVRLQLLGKADLLKIWKVSALLVIFLPSSASTDGHQSTELAGPRGGLCCPAKSRNSSGRICSHLDSSESQDHWRQSIRTVGGVRHQKTAQRPFALSRLGEGSVRLKGAARNENKPWAPQTAPMLTLVLGASSEWMKTMSKAPRLVMVLELALPVLGFPALVMATPDGRKGHWPVTSKGPYFWGTGF